MKIEWNRNARDLRVEEGRKCGQRAQTPLLKRKTTPSAERRKSNIYRRRREKKIIVFFTNFLWRSLPLQKKKTT